MAIYAWHRHTPRELARGPQQGWVMLALLFTLALLGIGMAAVGTLWETTSRRDKEAELLFIGDQFAQALQSYYNKGPGTAKTYPKELKELLADPRFPMTVRHLRRLYRDPMTGLPEWGLLRNEHGMIVGVHSLSEAEPLKSGNFPRRYVQFENKKQYLEWVFAPEQVDTKTSAGPEGQKVSADAHDMSMHGMPPEDGAASTAPSPPPGPSGDVSKPAPR